MDFFSFIHPVYLAIFHWVVRLVLGVVIVMRRRSPSAALTWLLVVFIFPEVGAIAYFLIGENRLGAGRVKRYREIVEHLTRMPALSLVPDRSVVQPPIDSRYQPIANLAEGLGGGPPLGRNDLTLYSDTDDLFDAMVEDIDRAEHHCHLLYYIMNEDRVAARVTDALVRARQRGVRCRVLLDSVGSKEAFRCDLCQTLKKSGVELAGALPVNPLRARVARLDLRNHRKLAIIDGRIAYTGSHNLSEPIYPKKEQFGAWVDATVRITGPAVQQLQLVFLEDWYLETEALPPEKFFFPPVEDFAEPGITVQSLPTGPISDGAPLRQMIIEALHAARQEAVLTTPYFVPDDVTVAALRSAALRGVRVILVVPKISDNRFAQAAGRSHYPDLLEAGIEIHEFTRGLLHSKTLTVDNDFALIGSANLDVRSFLLNFEMAVLIYDDNFASRLRFLQGEYMSESHPLTAEMLRRRRFLFRLGDNVAKLMSPLL